MMNLIFEPLGLPDPAQVIRLSEELIDELLCICALAPIAVVDLRAHYLPFVGATDASSSWMAAVRAEVPRCVVQECARYSLKKGNWSKLLPPEKAWLRTHDILSPEDELPDGCYNTHPLWTTLACSLEYKERWRSPCKSGQRINILELKAFVKEEKAVAKGYSGVRFLCGLDSQVSLGALVKGRAASLPLNSLLRSSLRYPLGSGVFSSFMYYASETNRADGPTRDAVPAPPSMDKPKWFSEIVEGKYDGFQQWMSEVEKGVVFPSFNCDDLMNGKELDCRPRRRVRRIDRRRVDKPAAVQSEVDKEKQPNDAPPQSVAPTKATLSEEDVRLPQIERLSEEAAAALKAFPTSQFFFGIKEERAFLFKGALDLYSGSFGVARQLVANGAPWVLTFEWKRSASEDLLDPDLQRIILDMIRLGCFLAICMAPICASFSMAVTPPIRTRRYPRGRPGLTTALCG